VKSAVLFAMMYTGHWPVNQSSRVCGRRVPVRYERPTLSHWQQLCTASR